LTAIRTPNALHAWTKIGAAFPRNEQSGIGIELKAEFGGIIHPHSTHETPSHLFDTCR
jgi:hypothetical protein